MKDIFMYLQFVIFVMNVVTFIYIMQHEKYNYKFARVSLLVLLSAGMIANIGKVTFLTILFTSSTFLSLLKIDSKNGNIHRFVEKFRNYFNRHKQHLQGLQGSDKTLSRQKA